MFNPEEFIREMRAAMPALVAEAREEYGDGAEDELPDLLPYWAHNKLSEDNVWPFNKVEPEEAPWPFALDGIDDSWFETLNEEPARFFTGLMVLRRYVKDLVKYAEDNGLPIDLYTYHKPDDNQYSMRELDEHAIIYALQMYASSLVSTMSTIGCSLYGKVPA